MTTRIRTAAVLGAGTMGAQIAAHLANAGVPTLLLDVTPEVAREGLERAKAMKPDPFFTPSTHTLDPHRRVRPGPRGGVARATGSSRRSSSGSTSSSRSSRRSSRIAARTPSSARTRRGSRLRRWPKDAPNPSAVTSSAPTSSIRRDTCVSSRSSRRRIPTRPSSPRSRNLRTAGSARASSWRRTRRTSSPTTSASTA